MTPTLEEHYFHVLRHLFHDLSADTLLDILKTGERQHLQPGDYLFNQGDLENSLYIVLSGRLRVVAEDKTGLHILGDIGEGEPTGEFALFTNEPRMASVLAIRMTTVLQINKQNYLYLVSQSPAFAGVLTNFLIKGLKRNILEQHLSTTPKNIALINLQSDHDLSPWTDAIKKTLKESGIPVQIFDQESKGDSQFSSVFDSLEQYNGLNVLVCSEAHPEWSSRCLLYADLVIVATDFAAPSKLYPIERMLDLYSKSILNKKIYLVFLHGKDASMPTQTSRWFENRAINLHIHVRRGHEADIRRFCRIISNRAIGVVLGGGGSKGYAHVGALRALVEAGIEVDFLGGTSAGALYGIGVSHADFNFERANELCEISAKRKLTSNDYAWPMISLMSGHKITAFMKDMFGESELEDLRVNSYCVSTNFSSSGTKVHDRGLARKMIQASIAIPGVFPPVVIDRQLHVDGGVVDNLPIEPMYRYPVQHIIAISLSGLTNREVEYSETPSGGQLLWDKLTGKKRFRIPGIISVIVNSLTLNSRQKQEVTKAKVSLYLEMDLKGVSLLDDKKWRQTMEKGHNQMKRFLETVSEKDQFWAVKNSIHRESTVI